LKRLNHDELVLTVPLYEIDIGGGVYHAGYFHFFEQGRESFLRALGFPYPDLVALGFHLTVAECRVRFYASLHYNERVVVETSVTKVGRRSLRFHQRIRRGEDLCTEADLDLVCVNATGPALLPEKLKSKLTPA